MRNVFERLATSGTADGFAPLVTDEFMRTYAAPGSREKLEVMAQRVRQGSPLWHPNDGPPDEERRPAIKTARPLDSVLADCNGGATSISS